jgi:TRAP-type mannitol/chloroaromatic compound transport system substrate-binding protein
MSGRRRFIATAGGTMAGVAAGAIVNAPYVIAQPKVQWRMSTAYPATLDVLHGSAQRFAKAVEEASGGRFRIEVYPGGQIMDPYACFDAASKGTIEGFMASSWTWSAKEPAFSWFGTIPFGMNGEGMTAWCYQGDGLRLWEEAYGAFNLVPRPGMAIAPQMAGWFRKKLTTIGDYKGLKMRIAGLGGQVIARAGATAVVTPGSEIYSALERGVIDAAEWVGPQDDMKLGLHKTARYYYYPGWQDCGTLTVFGFNKKAYEALPIDLRRMIDHAAAAVQVYGLADFHAKNAIALERLKTEFKGKVEILPVPVPVLRDLKKLAAEIVKEESERTPMARKVHASFTKFQALVGPWDRVAEGVYHQLVAG